MIINSTDCTSVSCCVVYILVACQRGFVLELANRSDRSTCVGTIKRATGGLLPSTSCICFCRIVALLTSFQISIAVPMLYTLFAACARLATCRLYVDIFLPASRYAIWLLCLTCGLYLLTLLSVIVLVVVPDTRNTLACYLATAITGLLVDILLCILPVSQIWKLQMHRQKKALITIRSIAGLM